MNRKIHPNSDVDEPSTGRGEGGSGLRILSHSMRAKPVSIHKTTEA